MEQQEAKIYFVRYAECLSGKMVNLTPVIGLGFVFGIIKYGSWKTREWFSFINKYQPSIEDSDWWGYTIYKKYPLLAFLLDFGIGLILSFIIVLMFFN